MKLDRFRNAVAAMILVGTIVPSLGAAELSTQRSTQRGVTVLVIPRTVARDTQAWEFKIVLDTHSQDLSDDLTK